MGKQVFRVSDRSDTNQPVQSQKKVSSLKFPYEEEEGLYYLCSENSYYTADLHLCFCIGKNPVFS